MHDLFQLGFTTKKRNAREKWSQFGGVGGPYILNYNNAVTKKLKIRGNPRFLRVRHHVKGCARQVQGLGERKKN